MTWEITKEIRELEAESQKVFGEARSILESVKGNMNPEQTAQFEKLHSVGDANRDKIAQLRKQLDADHSLETRLGREEISLPNGQEDNVEARNKAFTKWLKVGKDGLNSEERSLLEVRAISTMDTATSGHGSQWVPTHFYNKITDKLKTFGGVFESGATVINTDSMAAITFPVGDDTGNKAVITTESNAVTDDNTYDPVSSNISVQPYLFNTKAVRVSLQLLAAASFDVESYVAGKLAERIYRGVNESFTTGNSTNLKGVVTGSTAGKTAASATAVTWAEILDLKHSVNSAYRNGAKFMFNDSVLCALKKLVDSTGKGLWSSGNAALNIPATIDGDPYIINDDMASMTASAKSILYGDFSRYHIVQVNNFTVRRLDEKYIDYLQVGFLGYGGFGGNLVDTTSVKHLVQASS